ncbi:ribonuclease H-like domain-containing protein [Syncephalis plumigaleata]|nr:ribonuclease H-like domain-containing protein [Syncephalis plumigaleata]
MATQPGPLTRSYTYHTEIPKECTNQQPCLLGVDEAGRGPVLGPMVYSICYCPIERSNDLGSLGFADSKTLNEKARDNLLDIICQNRDYIGWGVRVLSPQDLSQWMLRRNKYNLNSIAHDTTIQLLREALAANVNIKEVYIDTVGPPESYQAKLSQLFPHIKITVAKKADSLYPIVSAASICAKVTRDAVIKQWTFDEPGADAIISREFGSGYSSDPNTVKWLNSHIDPVFGFPGIVRFSWATCERLLEEKASTIVWDEGQAKETTLPDQLQSSLSTTDRSVIFTHLGMTPMRNL